MGNVQYTDEQQTEGVRLYVEHGPDYAAEQIGCNRATIFRWAARHATVATQKREDLKDQISVRWQVKREALQETMLDTALAGAVAAREILDAGITIANAKAFQALSIGVGTFLDKFRLEQGEATERTHLTGAIIPVDPKRLALVMDVMADLDLLPVHAPD